MSLTTTTSAFSPTRQCELSRIAWQITPCQNWAGPIEFIAKLLREEYLTSASAAWPAAVISEPTLQNDTIEGRPIIARWEWGGATGAHFVIISGYLSEDVQPYRVLFPGTTTVLRKYRDYDGLVYGYDADLGSYYNWIGYVDTIYR